MFGFIGYSSPELTNFLPLIIFFVGNNSKLYKECHSWQNYSTFGKKYARLHYFPTNQWKRQLYPWVGAITLHLAALAYSWLLLCMMATATSDIYIGSLVAPFHSEIIVAADVQKIESAVINKCLLGVCCYVGDFLMFFSSNKTSGHLGLMRGMLMSSQKSCLVFQLTFKLQEARHIRFLHIVLGFRSQVC